jgi:NitT/TauT family transport system substrate-binding protein
MKNILYSSAMLFFAGFILIGCEPSEPKKPPDEVKLQLKWLHQAQFAGFYMAQEKGYYAKENIKVTFIEGEQGIDIAHRIVSSQADFGVLTPEFIFIKRSQGLLTKPFKVDQAYTLQFLKEIFRGKVK